MIVISLGVFTLAALLLHENLVLLAGAVSLAVALASRFWVARNLRDVRIRRSIPSRARCGIPSRIAYEIDNPTQGTAVGITVQDPLCAAARPRALLLQVPGIEKGQGFAHDESVTFMRRGRSLVAPPRLASRFPLGFFEKIVPSEELAVVLVRPREGRPTVRLREALGGHARAFHRPSLRARGDDVFHGIRDFRDGDDPRRIHWKTTARTGELTVAEWHREEGRDVVIVLGRADGTGRDGLATFERAVSTAATIVRLAARHGLRVRLALGGRHESGRVEAPRTGVRSALDALALVKPQGGRRPRAVLRSLARRAGSRIVFYVAAGPEPGVEGRLGVAAGSHGKGYVLRADRPDIRRWIRGLD